jgi:PPOX class probable F420-dependent enzyme
MLDFHSQFGRHVNRRLREEKIIWLTTVDSENTPEPRPVWFQWDRETVLIFSQQNKAKLRHISRNPRVSLNFSTNADGGDVAVLIGEAKILDAPPDLTRVKTYLRKYREDIKDLGMSIEEFSHSYSVPILVTPQSMRGFAE